MDCRQFRDRHLALLDATLSDLETVEMQRHLLECEACARHDTTMRRGLLIFRNLPPIEPSADFAARLEARIARAREDSRRRAAAYGRQHGPSARAFAAAAAGVMAAGYLAILTLDAINPPEALALAPVVATAPEPAPTPVAAPAYVASFSAGMPLWPAALVADMAPVHFANTELRTVSLTR
jgi:anti-sigma factor RsiW